MDRPSEAEVAVASDARDVRASWHDVASALSICLKAIILVLAA